MHVFSLIKESADIGEARDIVVIVDSLIQLFTTDVVGNEEAEHSRAGSSSN